MIEKDEELKNLLKQQKEAAGDVHKLGKLGKQVSKARSDLSSSMSKEAEGSGMDTAMKLAEGSKGLKLALNTKSLGKAQAVSSLAQTAGLVPEGEVGGAATGALSGASAGAAFGAPGAIIGGVLGGVSGAIGAGEKRKQKLAQIEANKQKALGDIAERKAERLQSAFSNLGASLSGLF